MSNPIPPNTHPSVFAAHQDDVFAHRFNLTLHIPILAAGTPANPNVIESWLKTKLAAPDDLIRAEVAKAVIATGATADAAAKQVAASRHLNVFKRDRGTPLAQTTRAALLADLDPALLVGERLAKAAAIDDVGELYIEGRQLKAAIKEAISVAVDTGGLKPKGYGLNSRKGALSFLAEHVFVIEDQLLLGVTEPTGVMQRPVSTYLGTSIQYEQYLELVDVHATVITDHDYNAREWAAIWLTGQQQGIGASRSQGYGRYTVTQWERIK